MIVWRWSTVLCVIAARRKVMLCCHSVAVFGEAARAVCGYAERDENVSVSILILTQFFQSSSIRNFLRYLLCFLFTGCIDGMVVIKVMMFEWLRSVVVDWSRERMWCRCWCLRGFAVRSVRALAGLARTKWSLFHRYSLILFLPLYFL